MEVGREISCWFRRSSASDIRRTVIVPSGDTVRNQKIDHRRVPLTEERVDVLIAHSAGRVPGFS
jgi:hypothetical protein